MLTLTAIGIEKQAQRHLDSLHHGQFKVNGAIVDNAPLYKKVRSGDTIRIYLAIEPEYVGKISEIKIIDNDGDVVVQSQEVIEKPESKGIYVTYKYKYKEQEGVISE